jgi:hypothetical protein
MQPPSEWRWQAQRMRSMVPERQLPRQVARIGQRVVRLRGA